MDKPTMNWEEELREKWVTGELMHVSDIEDFIQSLLDQRDEEIIGKLEEHIENDCDDLTSKYYIEAINHAISTIKETRKK